MEGSLFYNGVCAELFLLVIEQENGIANMKILILFNFTASYIKIIALGCRPACGSIVSFES